MEGGASRLSIKVENPYKARVFDEFLLPEIYNVLASTFPIHGFRALGKIGNKIHLNESHDEFEPFMEANSIWCDFYRWCKDGSLEAVVADTLPIGEIVSTRFEFSILPTNGGGLNPHPDTNKKKATVIFYFPPEGWNLDWGGNFEVLRLKEHLEHSQNPTISDVHTVVSVDYVPNRVIMLRRTASSWHQVRPIGGPPGRQRRSVTFNLLGDRE